MDTTKKNILMCEKAEEIQKIWKPRVGDLAWRGTKYLPTKDACGYLTDVDVFDTQGYKARGSVWLPRQDQLQEMVNEGSVEFLTRRFNKFALDECHIMSGSCHLNGFAVFETLEQLWLAFVMKEKYNKIWNGTDWVLIN